MTKDLFDTNTTVIDPPKDLDTLYNDLVGEGKRYKDPKVLLKTRLDADDHIRKIEEENARLRADLTTRASVEEALAKLNLNSKVETPVTPEHVEISAVTPEMIQAIVDKELAKRQTQSQTERNKEFVISKLVEAWGDSYSSRLKERAKELQLSEDFLTRLAVDQPQAFLTIVDPKPVTPPQNLPNSGRRPVFPSTPQKNWDYYNKMRKENPSLYNNKNTQLEIMAQAKQLGDSFYSKG